MVSFVLAYGQWEKTWILLRCNNLWSILPRGRTLVDQVASGSTGNLGEFGWGGAAGATVLIDPQIGLSVFYAHHMLNPQESYYQPRLRNVVYDCL